MRERIVSAAERVMREKGLARSTTREIAEAANCSEGALYRHFRSKEELFVAVLAERLPDFLPVMHELADQVGSGTVRGHLEKVARSAIAFYADVVPMTAPLLGEHRLLEQHRTWLRDANAGPQRAVDLLARYLRGEQRSGRLAKGISAEAAAHLLLGACFQRAYLQHMTGSGSADDHRFSRRVVDVLLNGCRPGPEAD